VYASLDAAVIGFVNIKQDAVDLCGQEQSSAQIRRIR